MTGQTISHFCILDKLGEGGMGVVYKAEDTKLKRLVALKFLPAHLLGKEDVRKRFEREAKSAAALDHPNVCHVHEIDEAEGKTFIAMALVEGESLEKKIARGPLRLEEASSIAQQVAKGLEAAHKRGIVHRDIKPENIMVGEDGHVTIMDFGLAQFTEASRLTRTDETLGTVAYMSPEQTEGSGTDHRTDIWSLGVVLYEMITGLQPFKGDYEKAVMYSILNEKPEPVTALRTGVPIQLELLVGKCLSRNPAQRYQSVRELTIDVTALRSEGKRAATTRVDPSPAALPRREGRPFGWIAAAAMALIAGWLWLGSSTTGFQTATQQTLRVDLDLPGLRPIGSDFELSADGSALLYAGYSEGYRHSLHYRPLGSSTVTPVPNTQLALFFAFSPDGEWAAFHAAGRLQKAPVSGGPAVMIAELPEVFGISWGRDGHLVYGTPGDGLFRVSEDGGESERLTGLDAESGEGAHRWPKHAPDGDAILFTIWPKGGGLDRCRVGAIRNGNPSHISLMDRALGGSLTPQGEFLFVRSNALYAAPFDTQSFQVSGSTVLLVDEIFVDILGKARYALGSNGLLAYLEPSTIPLAYSVVYEVDRSGRRKPLLGSRTGFSQPRYSPDGRRIVLTNLSNVQGAVWVFDRERDVLTRIGDTLNHVWPVWAPDGERVVYLTERTGAFTIWWTRADGSGEDEQLVFSQASRQSPSSFSADGILAFEQGLVGSRDLWMLPVYGDRKPYEFLATEFNEQGGQFSPDDRWLAFSSNRSGQDEVYVTSFPERSGFYQVSSDGGVEPVWSRDGKEIFYRNGNKMMAANILPGPEFRTSAPEMLFEGSYTYGYVDWSLNYDVAPDGESFLMVVDGDRTDLQIVTNFFEQIEVALSKEH